MTNGAAVGGAAERQDEVQRHRPGGGRIEFSALDVADEGPQCAGLLVEGVAEGAAQLDVTLDLLAEEYSEVGHTAPPGKESATSASCEAATFTYSAVVLMLRCPRRSATSLIGLWRPTSWVWVAIPAPVFANEDAASIPGRQAVSLAEHQSEWRNVRA